LLTIYHREFAAGVPAGTPPDLLKHFSNPLMLPIIRPQLEEAVAKYPGGLQLLNLLFKNVKTALEHGVEFIFFIGAIILSAAVVLNFFLKEIPLRGKSAPEAAAVQQEVG
jgi:hypothetical protein